MDIRGKCGGMIALDRLKINHTFPELRCIEAHCFHLLECHKSDHIGLCKKHDVMFNAA
jgi:hypothetical protein